MTDVVQPRSRLREGRLTIVGLLGRFGFYLALLILILLFRPRGLLGTRDT